jgi:hypothetical protein
MNWSDELKVIWLTPMRTGTRSCGEIMRYFNFKNNYNVPVPSHDLKIPEGKEDYFLIFNIRNPYSRMVSLFNLFTNNNKNFNSNFDQWVLNDYIFYNYNFYLSDDVKELPKKVDHFIRIEKFEEDVNNLFFIKEKKYDETLNLIIDSSITKNRYEKEFENNVTNGRKHWKSFYTQETADFFYNRFKDDFIFFSYDKNSWK